MQDVVLKIGDFLGYCDLNGVEAIQTDQVQELEEYIRQCNDAYHSGSPLVADGIWDRLMEILGQVSPESELVSHIWEDSVDEYEDTDVIIRNNPMFSIQTVKSFDCDELKAFVDRLPEGEQFDAHVSVKLNGHGIRLKYQNGKFIQARSRARSSAGRDITEQLRTILERDGLTEIADLENFDLCEIRGEWVLPFSNLETARSYNDSIKSAFSGVASMGRDSASPEEWGLLNFVAYEFLADDMVFQTKSEEYELLEDLGFETPMNWLIEGLEKSTLLEELKGIVEDCETEVKPSEDYEGYSYYTDGLVFCIDDYEFFRSLGDDGGHYKHGNIALKVGYWKQDMYEGYVQCILWTQGKTKLSPVAILAPDIDCIEYKDGRTETSPVYSKNEVANWDALGVVTASGNKVRRVPLYEPSNMVMLDAYPGRVLHFRYGGEAGVVPCFEDGTPLLDGRIRQALTSDSEADAFFSSYEEDGYYE